MAFPNENHHSASSALRNIGFATNIFDVFSPGLAHRPRADKKLGGFFNSDFDTIRLSNHAFHFYRPEYDTEYTSNGFPRIDGGFDAVV